MPNLTRRDFIKLTSAAALAMAVPVEVFAADKKKADLAVYGKIFTSEDNKIVEAFAVKKATLDEVQEHLYESAHVKPNWIKLTA